MTFRATYIMATRMRDEMLDAGRRKSLDELVAAARGLQDEILGGEPVQKKGITQKVDIFPIAPHIQSVGRESGNGEKGTREKRTARG